MPYRHLIAPLLIVLLLALLPAAFTDLLRYERASVDQGEVWRLLSASWVSLGFMHAALNSGALLLLWCLARHDWTPFYWWLTLIVTGAGVHIALWFMSPESHWAVGLSGALHGLAVVVIAICRSLPLTVRALAPLLIGVKAIGENYGFVPVASETLIGGHVLVQAHLYGWMIGLALLFLFMGFNVWQRASPRPTAS